jgi:DNA-binding MarR family transcriptional regulator
MNTNEMKELVSKIMKVNRLHRSVISDNAGGIKLQRSGHMMLLYILKSENPPSQKEIAKSFGITPAAVAMTLKKMEKSGLIERMASEDDNRVNLIKVSEKGRALLENNRQRFEDTDRAMLSGIPDGELEAASRTLDKMVANLIKAGAKDEPPPFAPKESK